MSNLLPSTPDTGSRGDADPRVVGLESDEADDLLSALSSETARKLLAALHEEPATPSAVADRIDTSLQNAQYHLENLEEADAIEVVDTVYSEKGREMKVYAPTSQPLVVFAGDEDSSNGLKNALSRLLGSVGALAVASVAVQAALGGIALPGGTNGGTPTPPPTARPDGGEAGRAPANGPLEPAEQVSGGLEATAQAVSSADPAGAGSGFPPGLLFFAGGLVVLLAVFAVWYARGRGY